MIAILLLAEGITVALGPHICPIAEASDRHDSA